MKMTSFCYFTIYLLLSLCLKAVIILIISNYCMFVGENCSISYSLVLSYLIKSVCLYVYTP